MKLVAVSEDGEHIGVTLTKEDAAIILSCLGPEIPFVLYTRAQKYADERLIGNYKSIEWEKDGYSQGEVILALYDPLHDFLKVHK